MEDLAELELSSKKKAKESKDDFEIMLRTATKLDIEETKKDQLSEKKPTRDPNVAKQLNELFVGDDLPDNQMLKGKSHDLDLCRVERSNYFG